MFAGALLAFAVSVPQTLMAQAASPNLSIVNVSTIKPEMRAEYEAFQKQVTAAYKKAEVPYRTVLETVLGNLAEYVTIAPVAKFADLDGPTPMERALGKPQAEAMLRKGAVFVTSRQRLLSRDMPELSIMTDSSEPPALAMVTMVQLKPGSAPDFAAWVKDEYLPAARKAELKNLWISQALHGGSPDERIIVRPIKSMADFDGGPFTIKALGQEAAAKMMAKLAGMAQSRSYSVMKYRADLSYRLNPPPQRAAAAK
jgi:hypothetical protein